MGAGLIFIVAVVAAAFGDTLYGYVPRTYSAGNASEITMPYRLHVPPSYSASNKYPFVLFLHGAADRGADNALPLTNNPYRSDCVPKVFTSDAYLKKYPCIVAIPQVPSNAQWVDWSWSSGSYHNVAESKSLRTAAKIVATLRKEFSIDSARIYAVGLSMGGYGCWDVIERYPAVYAAAIPLCGGADTTRSVVMGLKNTRIWQIHGTADGLVPVSGAREIAAALKRVGDTINYTEIPGGDHYAPWRDEFCPKSKYVDWLFAQSKPGSSAAVASSGQHAGRCSSVRISADKTIQVPAPSSAPDAMVHMSIIDCRGMRIFSCDDRLQNGCLALHGRAGGRGGLRAGLYVLRCESSDRTSSTPFVIR